MPYITKIFSVLKNSLLPEESFLFRWLRKLPIPGKLHVFTALIGLMTVVGLVLIVFGMNTLSALRAYVVAESRWAEAERAAVYSLLRYTVTYDEKDFKHFAELMTVVSLPHLIRPELEKQEPELDVISKGLLEVGLREEELGPALSFFRRFQNFSYLRRAFEIWTEAEQPIVRLEELGEQIHSVVSEVRTMPERLNSAAKLGPLVVEVDATGSELSRLATSFSLALEEASRRIETILMRILIGTIILVGLLALGVTVSINRLILQVDRTKSEFVSLVSHQLRTPLAIIKWYGEKLLKDFSSLPVSNKVEYLGELYHATERMSKLVDDVLSVSRIELGSLVMTLESLDLAKTADEVLSEYGWEIESKKIEVKKEYGGDAPKIRMDRKILEILLENLIGNAVHYTPPGGSITVGFTKQKTSLIMKIADTGYGIPESQQELVFSKLFRGRNVRDRGTGTGLGLYIVKSLVDQLDGDIWFQSKENYGTTFWVKLPLESKG